MGNLICGGKQATHAHRSGEDFGFGAPLSSSPRKNRGDAVIASDFAIHDDIVFDVTATDKPGELISCSDDRTVVRYDWKNRKVLDRWRGHKKCVNKVVFAPRLNDFDGAVFSASRDATIKQWRQGHSEAVQTLSGHTMNIRGLSIDSENRRLVSGGRDYSLRFWDVESGQQTAQNTIERNIITCLCYVPGEQQVLQGGEDLQLRVWDERQCAVAQSFASEQYFPLDCDVSPDGLYFVTSCNGFDGAGCEVRVWDRRRGALLTTLAGHAQAATTCRFLPPSGSQGLRVVSASKDRQIKVWDVSRAQCVSSAEVPGSSTVTSLAVGPVSAQGSGASESGFPAVFGGCAGGFVFALDWSHQEAENQLSLVGRTAIAP